MAISTSVATLNWYFVPITYIGREEYNALLASLRNNPDLEEIEGQEIKARRIAYFYNRFQVVPTSHSSAEIRVVYNRGNGMSATRYKYMASCETVDDQNGKISGGASYDILDHMFYDEHKKTIFAAYTARQYKSLYPLLKACVPPQPHYALRTKEVLDHGYKADVSSCFPAELSKSLPTLRGSQQWQGRIAPTEEFPFAFYLNSHHIAIYNEFHTRELRSRWYINYYSKMYDDLVPAEDEVTLLCPACEFTFENVMRKLYNGRSQHAENKDVMNKTIGVFHYNGNPRLAHVAAVVIARCIYLMNLRADILTSEGNKVYHIATDAILWRGNMSPIVCADPKEKDMGKFMLEERNVDFCVRSPNCYQYARKDGEVITRFSGNISDEERRNMKLGDILNYKGVALNIPKYYQDDNGFFVEAKDGN